MPSSAVDREGVPHARHVVLAAAHHRAERRVFEPVAHTHLVRRVLGKRQEIVIEARHDGDILLVVGLHRVGAGARVGLGKVTLPVVAELAVLAFAEIGHHEILVDQRQARQSREEGGFPRAFRRRSAGGRSRAGDALNGPTRPHSGRSPRCGGSPVRRPTAVGLDERSWWTMAPRRPGGPAPRSPREVRHARRYRLHGVRLRRSRPAAALFAPPRQIGPRRRSD